MNEMETVWSALQCYRAALTRQRLKGAKDPDTLRALDAQIARVEALWARVEDLRDLPVPATFRLRVTTRYADGTVSDSFLYRDRNGAIRFMGSDETPLALSNLLGRRAAETRFALEDCSGGEEAARLLQVILDTMWAKNPAGCPKVVELK